MSERVGGWFVVGGVFGLGVGGREVRLGVGRMWGWGDVVEDWRVSWLSVCLVGSLIDVPRGFRTTESVPVSGGV